MTAKEWSTACPDWRERIKAGRSLVPFEPLFPAEAADAMGVFGELQIVDAGSVTMRDASRPWVNEFVSSVFGAYDPESGRRLVTEWFLLISKKNTKSTTAAGIMLTALIRNWRHSAEFLIVAPTVEVANNAFKPAQDMVNADPELKALMHVQGHIRTITHMETGAALKVVAADSESVGGKKATGVLIDELWMFGKRENAENMLREACGGLASRPEGFTIFLSTQSDEPPAGVFKQKLQYARDVRDGKVIDPRFLPVLYEFPEEMIEAKQHRNPEFFYVTNPNLGLSVDVPFLEHEFKKAENAGEQSMLGFMAKHLNVEIGLNLRSDRWAGADFWESSVDKSITLDSILERCDVVVVGIDGGGLDDLLGLAVLGRDRETRKWLLWCHAWAHKIVFVRRQEIAPRLRDFEKAKELTVVDSPGEDVMAVADIVCRIKDAGLLPEKAAIGVDAAGIIDIVEELMSPDRGIAEGQIIAIPQGWKLNAAIKTAERKVAGGELVHAGQPLMNWCVGNAKVEVRSQSVVITKQASGTGKIDPLMATFDAVALMSQNPQGSSSGAFLEFLRQKTAAQTGPHQPQAYA